MHPTILIATARRVTQQLGHDVRTLALLFVVPTLLLGLLAWMYDGGPVFDRVGAPLLGIFPLIMMFGVTSVATLRERSSGTLERLLALPTGKLDILLGYAVTFGAVAIAQAAFVSSVAVYLYDLDVAGPQWFLVLVSLSAGLLGTALGLCASALAKTEFQAVQFMPAFVLPQALLCGLVVPLEQLPRVLEVVARAMPLTYIVDAEQFLIKEARLNTDVVVDLLIVGLFTVGAILLGAATLRRQTK